MKLSDLKVGMDVVMVTKAYITKNMDTIENGYRDRKTGMFFSNDMVENLCGKKVRITEIDASDDKLNVVANDYWLNSDWIAKEYVKPAPRPKKPKPEGATTRWCCPKTAADGSAFGPAFKSFIRKHREFEDLSTNRISRLTDQEIDQICSVLDIDNSGRCQSLYETILEKMM